MAGVRPRRFRGEVASCGLRVEPTGALTLGAVIENPEVFHERRIIIVISGGNVDEDLWQSEIATGHSLLE